VHLFKNRTLNVTTNWPAHGVDIRFLQRVILYVL